MDPEFWAGKQARIRAGLEDHVYPYPEACRFKRRRTGEL
jgi:isocitrate dehydrogenase kinase/phosphatase